IKDVVYYVPYKLNLASFSVTKQSVSIEVRFATVTEMNTVSMVIERSANGVDFTKVGELSAAGNSQSQKSYIFNDVNPIVGVNHYRIRQTYSDNTSSYSEVKNAVYYNAYKLDLASFEVIAQSNAVVLNFVTATEDNTLRIEIERSVNNTSFIKIGTTTGAGNSTASISYSFADGDPVEGLNYYRLKQVYSDGTYSYSDVRSATYFKSLKLDLADFTVSRRNKITAELKWSTASESNTTYFEVERSNDGIVFTKIGQLSAAGNASVITSYSFVDVKPLTGNNFYRLKLLNIRNESQLSYIRSIDLSDLVTLGLKGLTVYPNPASDVIEVNMESVATKLTIYTLAGKPVKSATFAPGEAIREKISELSIGMYFLEVKSTKDNKILGTAKFFKN
ncbi:MAG: T9SS type A sorting domain-containing protein, partial [Pedobacter sp.]